jgi:uncharacterized membrane protein
MAAARRADCVNIRRSGRIDRLLRRSTRTRAARRLVHGIGNIAALILSIFYCLIHTRDAYTSVVPSGLILSALVVVILLVTGWNGWGLVHRHAVGVRETKPQ